MSVPIYVTLASLAVVVSMLLMVYAVSSGRRRSANSRRDVSGVAPLDQRSIRLQEGAVDRAVRPAVRVLANRAKRITPAGWLEALERRIQLLGPKSRWTADRVLAGKILLFALGVPLGIWLGPRLPGNAGPVFVILVPVIGYFLPDVLIRERGKERQIKLGIELPDTLDQVTISVEAGLGFDAALAYVAETGSGPLAEELTILLRDGKLGMPRSDALRHLVDRTDVAELRHFVFAIRQAEEYGLPIATVLRTQSVELRIRRRQNAEERAMKMPVKLVFPLALCIFPALFVVLLGPAILRVMDTIF